MLVVLCLQNAVDPERHKSAMAKEVGSVGGLRADYQRSPTSGCIRTVMLRAIRTSKNRIGSPDGPRSLQVDQAAVDEQFGAGGVRGIGGEVEGCGGDFGCGAGAAERNAVLAPR